MRRVVRVLAGVGAVLLLTFFALGFHPRIGETASRLYLVDISGSLRGRLVELMGEVVRHARSVIGGRVGIAVFGSEALLLRDFVKPSKLSEPEPPATEQATNIEKALRFTSTSTSEIVLLTDGNATEGDPLPPYRVLRERGLRLFVVPVEWRPRDFALSHLWAPDSVSEGEPFELICEVRGTVSGAPLVRVKRDGKILLETRFPVSPEKRSKIRIVEELTEPGLYRYEFKILDTDDVVENDRLEKVVRVGGAVGVLEVGAELKGKLLRRIESLRDADCVLIFDTELWNLPEEVRERVDEFVREGGGLVMAGARRAFGGGGYSGSAFENILPVEWGKRREGLALALLLDSSGSMAGEFKGRRKIDFAKGALLRLLPVLDDGDYLAIVTFSDEARTVLPLRRKPKPEDVLRGLRAVLPAGPTELGRGLDRALEELVPSPHKKHLIVLSDGRSRGFETRPIVEKARRNSITITAIATGREVGEPLLRTLAEGTGGRYYRLGQISRLAERMKKEVVRVAGEFYEEKPRRVVPVNGEIKVGAGEVKRIALTKLKGTALACAQTERGEPLVALRRYGLGRSVAIATDGEGWRGFNSVLSSAIMWASPRRQGYQIWIRHQERGLLVSVLVGEDVKEVGGLPLELQVENDTLTLHQVGVRRYSAEVKVSPGKPLRMRVLRGGEVVARGVASLPYSPEWSRFGANATKLREIAELSGGELVDGLQSVPRRITQTSSGTKAGYLLLIGAFLLYCVAVLVRE